MPRTDTTQELRMFLFEERPAAVCVISTAKGGGLIEWLPRSLIGYARKEKPAAEGERQPYVFTLPEWKIEKCNLWRFVSTARG